MKKLGKFQWDDSVSKPFPCATCAHRWPGPLPVRCTAFPGGVPAEILRGDHQHRTPFPGDGGTQWAIHPRDLPPGEGMPR